MMTKTTIYCPACPNRTVFPLNDNLDRPVFRIAFEAADDPSRTGVPSVEVPSVEIPWPVANLTNPIPVLLEEPKPCPPIVAATIRRPEDDPTTSHSARDRNDRHNPRDVLPVNRVLDAPNPMPKVPVPTIPWMCRWNPVNRVQVDDSRRAIENRAVPEAWTIPVPTIVDVGGPIRAFRKIQDVGANRDNNNNHLESRLV